MKILNWCKAEEESICSQEGRKEGERLGVWEYWATKHLCQIKANPYLWEKDSVIPWAVFPPLKGRFLSVSLCSSCSLFHGTRGNFLHLFPALTQCGETGSAGECRVRRRRRNWGSSLQTQLEREFCLRGCWCWRQGREAGRPSGGCWLQTLEMLHDRTLLRSHHNFLKESATLYQHTWTCLIKLRYYYLVKWSLIHHLLGFSLWNAQPDAFTNSAIKTLHVIYITCSCVRVIVLFPACFVSLFLSFALVSLSRFTDQYVTPW